MSRRAVARAGHSTGHALLLALASTADCAQNPYEFMRFGDDDAQNPYDFTGVGDGGAKTPMTLQGV